MPGSYYDSNPMTAANSPEFILDDSTASGFPSDGIFVGMLKGPQIEVPALVDLLEAKGLCLLYNSARMKESANRCIERLVWRLAVSLPIKNTEFILYSGGAPGNVFTTHTLINDGLFEVNTPKVYFEGSAEQFGKRLDKLYDSIIARMSAISCAGKSNLVELNESLGKDAQLNYEFIFLADFPKCLNSATVRRLHQIVKVGAKAGIFVIMSWDMAAQFEEDRYSSDNFNPQELLQEMELLFPANDRILFRNSGHDDVLNRFRYEMDDAPVRPDEARAWASFVDKKVAAANKVEKPGILKQDFALLKNNPYEPTQSEISVTIGLDLTSKESVTLKFNSGDYIHAFILGQSGSGKSVLLNNIISSAILKYSPQDLLLYLMDFKGVEFNRYKGEKHTKAVLVDNSDPQMTLEVLRELRDENKRRVKLWQAEGVNNIDGYNRKHPDSRVPQVLFVADECQVMFQSPRSGGVQLDIHREIEDILNTIATQGRSQGIHMLLATQQLDETDISGQVLKNLTECLLLMSAPSDSNRLVPDSGEMTAKQSTGLTCYYHKKSLQAQVQTFYANDDELLDAIASAQKKAEDLPDNGAAYFCGSTIYNLTKDDIAGLQTPFTKYPTALLGRNIGLKTNFTAIPLKEDFSENILFFGANKQDQTVSVMMNALVSLIASCKGLGKACDFLVVDCLSKAESGYKALLSQLEADGLCHLIERQRSPRTIKAIAEDIKNGCASPVVLAIIGSERFVEMKRNQKLGEAESNAAPQMAGFETLSFNDPFDNGASSNVSDMTFQQAFSYILDEGPMQDVHILLQVDKPGNILFEGDYGVNATDKFRHKVILRSENKFLSPMRFSQDIDVETLSDEEEHLRAYYYPEGDDPVLFTPFLLPDTEILK